MRRQGSESSVATASSDTSAASTFMAVQAPPTTARISQPIHVRARALLRATCNSAGDFAGRVAESDTLRDFITSFFAVKSKPADDVHPILYISGSPGCGKTALINNVLNALEDDMQENGVRLSFVNCMAMNNLDAVWDRLATDFGSPKKRGKQVTGSEAVQKLFATRKDKWFVVYPSWLLQCLT